MDIIRRVPPEIIRAIIAAAGVNDSIAVSTWKKALSLLWVCRKWRIVAESMLFNTLFSGNENDDYSISNYELILQRRCFDKITQIIVRDSGKYSAECSDYPDNIDMMMNFGKLFDNDDGKKDIDSLDLVARGAVFALECDEHRGVYEYRHDSDSSGEDEYEYGYFSDGKGQRILYNEDELNDKCRNVSINIASKLAALCPNVTHLFLRFACSTITNDVLASVLINNYMKQLVKLKCDIPVADLKLKDGHNIQSLVLDDYDIDSGQLLQLPSYHVKNLSLSFEGDFNWGLFKCGNLAPAYYDNLIRLELGGNNRVVNRNAGTIAVDDQSAENSPLVVFPKLRTLVLRNICLPYYLLKHILQFPIKVLCVDGYIKRTLQLFEHNLEYFRGAY